MANPTKKDLETQSKFQKDVEFYSACVNGWIQNRMEKDKQLLTLSSLAIGVLLFFYKNLEDKISFVLWLIASLSFIFCIITVLYIFKKNAEYLEEVIKESSSQNYLEKTLSFFTRLSSILFIIGIITTFSISIYNSNFTLTKVQEITNDR